MQKIPPATYKIVIGLQFVETNNIFVRGLSEAWYQVSYKV